jgi:hypothetical protein
MALALRDMGTCVGIASDGLRLVSRGPAHRLGAHLRWSVLSPADDELGRFVANWVLPLEIDSDLIEIADPATRRRSGWFSLTPSLGGVSAVPNEEGRTQEPRAHLDEVLTRLGVARSHAGATGVRITSAHR